MQAFVSKLMAALLVAQAVSGWCCHRPCHCLDGEFAEAMAAVEDCDHARCYHDHDRVAFNAAPHCQCHECQGFCTYVTSAKSQVARSVSDFGSVLATATVDLSHPQLTLAEAARSGEPIQLEPPVRLHLLHQSLLI